MVDEAKDQTSISGASQPKTLSSNGHGYSLKVRKPYTITKQRERWAEEEHQRFIEALKLYGRAWSKIEEHVGTKTAIQIRSHAQKFFAKLAKDSGTDNEGSFNPIEIPPPRPKKKPLHPYPRKIADSDIREVFVSHQVPERSNDIVEKEYSPTSVLSAPGSDNLESLIADMHEFCNSSAEYTTDAISGDNLFTDNGVKNVTLNSPSKEAVENQRPTMKFELFPCNSESNMDAPDGKKASVSIKLFGKTVVIKENLEQYIEFKEKSETPNEEFDQRLASNDTDTNIITNSDNPSYSSQHSSSNIYYHMWNMLNMPWYPNTLCNTYSTSCIETSRENAARHSSEVELNDEATQQGSLLGSDTGKVNGGSQNSDVVDSKHAIISCKKGSNRGFVPYKRCVTERDDDTSMSFLQKREGQRARVCS